MFIFCVGFVFILFKIMQTLEKALHQPMPFTTGGQTITDRLTAAKHSLAGSQLGIFLLKFLLNF